ncbi:MAG: patatin-like phospholipase family protein [Proteobacteria bacterium]|nr:patatin-like phospholipase family protein [Pseudomonadota bacterium]
MSAPVSLPAAPPRLALVVGSGGVLAAAALGVVHVLAAEGMQPDLYVGCSSGALFGATLAMGMPAEHALQTALRLWSPELTRRRRWRAYAEWAAPRLMGTRTDFALRDEQAIAQRLAEVFGTRHIEQLPTPLRVATTEVHSGRAAVLRHGPLLPALRASMALPLLFPSVQIDGCSYVDGALSDPLPVAAAADAHLVIAVGVDAPMPRRLDRPARLAAQASTALINNLLQARLDAAHAAGRPVLALRPVPPRRIGIWDAQAMPDLFVAGRHAAMAALPRIAALLAPRPPRQNGTAREVTP